MYFGIRSKSYGASYLVRVMKSEEEKREELEKKNSLGIYRIFKKEIREKDYSGSLELMLWLRT